MREGLYHVLGYTGLRRFTQVADRHQLLSQHQTARQSLVKRGRQGGQELERPGEAFGEMDLRFALEQAPYDFSRGILGADHERHREVIEVGQRRSDEAWVNRRHTDVVAL